MVMHTVAPQEFFKFRDQRHGSRLVPRNATSGVLEGSPQLERQLWLDTADREDTVGHDEFTREFGFERICQISVEAICFFITECGPDSIACPNTPTPSLVGERHIDHVAETLDLCETAAVKGSHMLWMNARPSRQRPAGIVLENEIFGSLRDIPRDCLVAEACDEQTPSGHEYSLDFCDRSLFIEPPPALTRADKIKARIVKTRCLGTALHEARLHSLRPACLASDFEQSRSDIQSRCVESSLRKTQCESSGSRSKVQHPLAGRGPSLIENTIEEAVGETGSEAFIVSRGATEVNHSAFVIPVGSGVAHAARLAAGFAPATATRCEDNQLVAWFYIHSALGGKADALSTRADQPILTRSTGLTTRKAPRSNESALAH